MIGLIDVADGADAENITNAIVEHLRRLKIDIFKMFGFGSDGASVMTGKDSGVAKRLRDLVGPQLIAIHCIAHKIALSAKTVCESSDLCASADT